MKTTQTLLLGAVAAALLTATATVRAADFSVKDLSNRAIAASPRAKEQYPWLTRTATTPSDTVKRTETVVSTIRKNRALAASPRMLEQFPALARANTVTPATSTPTVNTEVARVLKNRAYAASPRAIEQYPWLARGYRPQTTTETIEVAPLK
jgi:hypothetical protein